MERFLYNEPQERFISIRSCWPAKVFVSYRSLYISVYTPRQPLTLSLFPFCACDNRHCMPQSQFAMNIGIKAITRNANPKYVAPVPSVWIMSSTNATMIAASAHRTRLFMAVLLAPLPGQRSATRVWLMENIAFADVAMRNCSISGRAIQPVRRYALGKDREKPYPAIEETNKAKIHGKRRKRTAAFGVSYQRSKIADSYNLGDARGTSWSQAWCKAASREIFFRKGINCIQTAYVFRFRSREVHF